MGGPYSRPESARTRPRSAPLVHICAPFYSAAVRSGLRRETWGRSLRAIMATSAVPATLKPSATLVCLQPWVTAEPTDLEDDMAAAMRAAVKKARGAAAPKTPPKAMPKTPPKAAPKAARRANHRASQPPCSRRAGVEKGQRSNWTSIWSAWELGPALLKPQLASRLQEKGARSFWQGSP